VQSGPPKKLITGSLIAEIKSIAGRHFFSELSDIKKAVHHAITEFKTQDKPDQADRLQSYYDRGFGRIPLDIWLFTSRAKKNEWIAAFQDQLALLRMSEVTAVSFKAPEAKFSLDNFYKKIIDYVDTPFRIALDNIIKDEEAALHGGPVFSAIKKHNGLQDAEYIKENLKQLIQYIKQFKSKPEFAVCADEFKKTCPSSGPDFEIFLKKILKIANAALGSDDYSTILGNTSALQHYLLSFYNLSHPDYRLAPSELLTMLPEIDFDQEEIKTPQPAQDPARLKEQLDTIVNTHIKRIQYFEVLQVMSLDKIEKKSAKANQFYLLKQPSGEWGLYHFDTKTVAPKKIPLYKIPGLKDILTEMKPTDFLKNKSGIQSLLTKYFTLNEQINRFKNFGVVMSSQLPEDIMGIDRYKFYLIQQKPMGFKLYVPDKSAKHFIEISPSSFPGLEDLIKKIEAPSIRADSYQLSEHFGQIKEILFRYALALQTNVYAKIDQQLFIFVNFYLRETPPDFLKIFIAASLAKQKMHHERDALRAICKAIETFFPIYNNDEWLAQALSKNTVYENIVLDFNKMWVTHLDNIQQDFTPRAIDELTHQEGSKVLAEAGIAINAIIKKSQKNYGNFKENPQDTKKYIEIVQNCLEELFDLKHDILLADAIPDMAPLLKGFANDHINNINKQIAALEKQLLQYQNYIKSINKIDKALKEKKAPDLSMIELEIKPTKKTENPTPKIIPPDEKTSVEGPPPASSPLAEEKVPIEAPIPDDVKSATLITPFLAEIDAIYKNKSLSQHDFFDWLKAEAFVNNIEIKGNVYSTQYDPNEASKRQMGLSLKLKALKKITAFLTTSPPRLRNEQILQISPTLKFDKLLMALIFANATTRLPNASPPPAKYSLSFNGFHFERFKFFKKRPSAPVVKEDVKSTLIKTIYQLATSDQKHAETIKKYNEQLTQYQGSVKDPKEQTIEGFITFCQKSSAPKP